MGLLIKSTTVLAVGEMAAIVRVELTNRGESEIETVAGVNVQGALGKHIRSWNDAYPPHELNNVTRVDKGSSAVVCAARESSAVAVQGVCPAPDAIRHTGFRYNVKLNPGQSWSMSYVYAIGDSEELAIDLFNGTIHAVDEQIEAARDDWNAELAALFTPDNDRYSGHLPRLETSDEAIRKVYWMGALGLAYFKRDSPFSVMGRTYDTLLPRYWQSVTFLWDYFLSSPAHAQLDPGVMKKYLEHWIQADLYKHFGTEYLTGGTVGYWYSVNDYAMTSMIRDYVRWTGDREWLGHVIEGTARPVIDFLVDFALHWKTLPNIGGVADYGGIDNLLECVSAYVHGVASLNAANVFNMRNAAELLDMAGQGTRANELRAEAEALLPAVKSLYVDGKGFFATRLPDGSAREVRHCYDFLTVLNTISNDLSLQQQQEMVDYFKRELRSETWMYALSPEDDNVLYDVRPDHQWTGAYPAWPPEAARGLFRIGATDLAIDYLRSLARTANQGVFGQAHFADSVVPQEDGGAMKCHPHMPCITDWACSSTGSYVNCVIEGLFGVEATPGAGITAKPQFGNSFDPDAKLIDLAYQGQRYDVTKDGM